MASEGFPENSIKINLNCGLTYTAVFFPKPLESTKSTILFLHGFPSSSYDWHKQIKYFSSKSYGVIAPDLLGYGGSSSPTSLSRYALKSMCSDLIAILEHCNLSLAKIHLVGHDFGSILLSTLLGYYPDIALTASFLSVPYQQPGVKVNMDLMKQITEDALGYELFGYRRFLWREDSTELIESRKESFFTLNYANHDILAENFLPPTRLEAFLKADRRAPLENWATDTFIKTRNKIFDKPNAYLGPTNWYRSRFRDHIGVEEEKKDLGQDIKIPCPALFAQAEHAKLLDDPTKQFAEIYEYQEVQGANCHFMQLEAPEKVNAILENLFERYPGNHAQRTSFE